MEVRDLSTTAMTLSAVNLTLNPNQPIPLLALGHRLDLNIR